MSRQPTSKPSAPRKQPDRTYLAVRRQLDGMNCDAYEVGLLNIDTGKMTPRVYSRDAVLKSVLWLKQRNAAGHHIYIRPQGSVGLILLDDIGLGTLKQLATDGFKPAAEIETSPTNFQAWVRVSMEPIPEELATKAAKLLAERYNADPNSADWRHFGRLAGFTNQKPIYIAEYGKAPYVLAHSCHGELAVQGSSLLSEAQVLLEQERAEREAQAQEVLKVLDMPMDGLADPVGFYQQQLGAIKARFGAGTDYSRADWMIGKKMSMLGYPPAVIQATLDQCSPDIGERKKGHEDDYTRRTVDNIMQDIEVLRQRSKLAEMLER
ncbi:DNA topoisomerase [Nodosilinea sp. LEGE 07298]|uniref:DNA-primase RepB domain-containing protein n=1 Tax=Nodosilinea sp. LEGE 07298 TaxID=2777970 RepID=UPI00187DFBBD|nr:DNA-primase RepB domain-containing protein [Nodosilinea sp. LEGE 07298]MBE9109302.1 DNA topoisomerase [Nodosilinea sp. LEGE 07298]